MCRIATRKTISQCRCSRPCPPPGLPRSPLSDRPPVDPVEAIISLPNNQWVVRVAPDEGWTHASYDGLLAGVVLVAVLVAALLFAALLSRWV